MKINDIIKKTMKDAKITQKIMATSIGKEKPNEISARLASKNMTFGSAIEMLNVVGAQVIVRDADGNEYVITE